MSERKLATVRKIEEIKPIDGADAIEAARVGGWWVVVKKNEFKEGEFCIFCEINSWISHDLAPFLTKGKEPREFNGVKGERLRTIRLRGQISQGLILPIDIAIEKFENSEFDEGQELCEFFFEGADLTELLQIQKYEKPIPTQLAGTVKGNFPSFFPKTDQERVQNLKPKDLIGDWEITEKCEGSSMSCYLNNGEFGVCSRNLDLKFDENNSFWAAAIKYDIENKMRFIGGNFAIQGELVGSGIQGDYYKLGNLQFYVFDVYDINSGSYLTSTERQNLIEQMGLNHVHVLGYRFIDDEPSIQELIDLADGYSAINPAVLREGLVYKDISDGSRSFKTISNQYLLKTGD